MAEAVYLLCALTSVTCAALLLRSYRETCARLSFWSAVCFVGLALNNVLLFVDLVMVPGMDLSDLRALIALGALLLFIWGLAWDSA